jgi:penicillin-binding protein 1A
VTGQGASTITQQLARNINELGLSKEKKIRRKVAEVILAMRIEQTFEKDEILELYLNQIYYGNGAYGIEAAARTYFNKHAKNLTLGEAAFLSGLPQRPARYSENTEAAKKRRDAVLLRMVETGKISPQQAEKAKLQPLKIRQVDPSGTRIYGAHHFVNYVMARLVNQYGADAAYSGWRVYTTINKKMQSAAEQALRQGIRSGSTPANQGALICLDPRTGYIKAMVGSLDFKKGQYNIITQGIRQPGSAFKPIVYAAAFDYGVADLDKSYRDDPNIPGVRDWHPKNYSGKYRYGHINVRSALKQSVNTIAAKVAMDTGLQRVIDFAVKLGINTPIERYPTLSLGASGVRPIELATAYGVFANHGRRAVPQSVVRVVDARGNVIEENLVTIVNTGIKESTITMINEGLQEAVLRGTGTAAASVPGAHGKTGTTSDNRDAWFAGYTPELVTVIWAGRENRLKNGKLDPKKPYLEMSGTTGGRLCAPMWRDYMLKALPIQKEAVALSKKKAAAAKVVNLPDDRATKPGEKVDFNRDPFDGRSERSRRERRNESPTTPNAPAATAPPPDNSTIVAPTTAAPEPTASQPGSSPTTLVVAPPTPRASIESPRRPRVEIAPRGAEPTGRISAPREAPVEETVSISICAESGRRASTWCGTTITRRYRGGEVPGRCREHRAPRGEG